MMGLHPTYVKKGFEKDLYLVEDWLKKRRFSAVGEIGTDLYWDKTGFSMQEEALKIQLQWAIDFDLPVVIHCRNSFKETVEIISRFENKVRGVFHCFSGTVEEAKIALALGFKLGIGGVSSYKNGGLDKVLPELDIKDLILETDSPYLAPVPHRGKRNDPSYIPIVAKRISELKKMDLDEIESVTTENSLQLFKM